MNRPLLLLMVPLLLIGSCIVAVAADPSANSNTPHQFPGKIVRVKMTGDEVFVLENVALTTLYLPSPTGLPQASENFLVGTCIKNGPHQTSWCEGMEVHLNLRSVSSYLPMTPEQWKDKQRATPTSATVLPNALPQPQARLNPIPPPPKPLEHKPIAPNQPAPIVPAAGPSLVPYQPAIPNPTLPSPQVVPTPVPPTQPTNPTAPPAAAIAPTIDAAPLKALQAERVKVLKQLVEISVAQYRVGTVDFNQLSSAQNEWCDAQLDSMDEPEKRVALLTKQIDMANDILKIVQARFEAGTVTELDICRAKSLHMGLKIKLLREQDGKRPPDSTGKQS